MLSAYLDGELAPHERQEVERLLASDPEARQTLADFRALRAALQSLPAERLEPDFRDRVLRLAEHRMLTEPLVAEPAELRPVGGVGKWLTRRLLRPRNLLWPAVAAAAAVLIVLWHGRPVDEVAVTPATRPNRDVAERLEPPALQPGPDDGWRPSTDAGPAGEVAADEVVVVLCEVTPEAARSRLFEQVLASHQLRPQAVSNDPAGALARLAGRASDRIDVSPQAVATKPIFVSVEATPAQLEAALAQLRAQPKAFRSVVVQSPKALKTGQPAGKRVVVFVLHVVSEEASSAALPAGAPKAAAP